MPGKVRKKNRGEKSLSVNLNLIPRSHCGKRTESKDCPVSYKQHSIHVQTTDHTWSFLRIKLMLVGMQATSHTAKTGQYFQFTSHFPRPSKTRALESPFSVLLPHTAPRCLKSNLLSNETIAKGTLEMHSQHGHSHHLLPRLALPVPSLPSFSHASSSCKVKAWRAGLRQTSLDTLTYQVTEPVARIIVW